MNTIKAKLRILLMADDAEVAEIDDPLLWRTMLVKSFETSPVQEATETDNKEGGADVEDSREHKFDINSMSLRDAVGWIMSLENHSMRAAEIVKRLAAHKFKFSSDDTHHKYNRVYMMMNGNPSEFANTGGLFTYIGGGYE